MLDSDEWRRWRHRGVRGHLFNEELHTTEINNDPQSLPVV